MQSLLIRHLADTDPTQPERREHLRPHTKSKLKWKPRTLDACRVTDICDLKYRLKFYLLQKLNPRLCQLRPEPNATTPRNRNSRIHSGYFQPCNLIKLISRGKTWPPIIWLLPLAQIYSCSLWTESCTPQSLLGKLSWLLSGKHATELSALHKQNKLGQICFSWMPRVS